MGNPISGRLGDNPRGALTDIRWSISAFRELDDWVGRIDPFNQRPSQRRNCVEPWDGEVTAKGKWDGSEMDLTWVRWTRMERERERGGMGCKKKIGKWASVQAHLSSSPPLMHPIPFPISTFLISNGSFEMVAGPRGKKLNTVTIMFNHYFCR